MSNPRSETNRSSWSELLDAATNDHQGEDTTVEALGTDIGDQVIAEHMALVSLSYDRKDDAVIVSVDKGRGAAPAVVRHIIEHPEQVLVDAVPPGIPLTVEIVGADGATTIVTVHQTGKDDGQPSG